MPVASAAPMTPISGTGPRPEMKMGSRMMFATAPTAMQNIVVTILPVACKIFSKARLNVSTGEKAMTT